ncbi:YcxB family protein [Pseudoalteromonas sp. T1lg75]|uniref:YcxB family protein n=1 Tax=Pseudoalteromonas sp. T1lg75 TaxID=2077102 RepID=UPI000CF6EC87|nr:YcxB family protein [Pseudoalteromonas sp. T1lg75]
MNYTTTYILNKDYFSESYEQSLPLSNRKQPKYGLILLLVALALFSILKLQNNYLGYFLFALALLEMVAYRYQKAWWIARQRLSRAAGHEVELKIDEQGIGTTANGKTRLLSWTDISEAVATDKGVVLVTAKGHSHYLSNAVLNDEVREFILAQKKQKPL